MGVLRTSSKVGERVLEDAAGRVVMEGADSESQTNAVTEVRWENKAQAERAGDNQLQVAGTAAPG